MKLLNLIKRKGLEALFCARRKWRCSRRLRMIRFGASVGLSDATADRILEEARHLGAYLSSSGLEADIRFVEIGWRSNFIRLRRGVHYLPAAMKYYANEHRVLAHILSAQGAYVNMGYR